MGRLDISVILEGDKIVLTTEDGNHLSDAVCELCTLLAVSSSSELPCMIFVKPYFNQLRWSASGKLEQVAIDKANLPTWPIAVFQNVIADEMKPAQFSCHLFSIEKLVNEMTVGFNLCEDLQVLITAGLVRLTTAHSLLVISITENLKLHIQALLCKTEWSTATTQLWQLCLHSIPDPYAEPLWQSQHTIIRPIVTTDLLPLLTIFDLEQLRQLQTTELGLFNEGEFVRALSAYSAATITEVVVLREFITSSAIALSPFADQDHWQRFFYFLDYIARLLGATQRDCTSMDGAGLDHTLPESICSCLQALISEYFPYGQLAILDWYQKLDSVTGPSSASHLRQSFIVFLSKSIWATRKSDGTELLLAFMLSGIEESIISHNNRMRLYLSEPQVLEKEFPQTMNNIIGILNLSFYRSTLRDFSSACIGLEFVRDFYQKYYYPAFNLWLVTNCELMQCLNAVGRERDARKLIEMTISMLQVDLAVRCLHSIEAHFEPWCSQLQRMAHPSLSRQYKPYKNEDLDLEPEGAASFHDENFAFKSGNLLDTPSLSLQKICTEANLQPFVCFSIIVCDSYTGSAAYENAEQILQSIPLDKNVTQHTYSLLKAIRLSKVMRRQNYGVPEDRRYLENLTVIVEDLNNQSDVMLPFCLDEVQNITTGLSEVPHNMHVSNILDSELSNMARQHNQSDLNKARIERILSTLRDVEDPVAAKHLQNTEKQPPPIIRYEIDNMTSSQLISPKPEAFNIVGKSSDDLAVHITNEQVEFGGWSTIDKRKLLYAQDDKKALKQAVCRGDIDVVTLLTSLPAIAQDSDGSIGVLLHLASKLRNTSIMQVLLDSGVSIDLVTRHSRTALHTVAIAEDWNQVERLFEDESSVASDDCNTVADSLQTVVKILLDRGASIDALDEEGRTPLHLAVRYGQEEMAQILLSHGADVETQDRSGGGLLHTAVLCSYETVVRVLLDYGALINAKDGEGRTALHIAAKANNVRTADTLLEEGASIDVLDEEGRTPLYLAVFCGRQEMVQVLLGRGAEVETRSRSGETLLHVAFNCDHNIVVSILLDHGASINGKDGQGRTVLHLAAKAHDFDRVCVLLDRGANIDAYDEDGRTPLHLAVRNHGQVIVQYLLDRGANMETQDRNGETPLQAAVLLNSETMVKMLVDYGAPIDARDRKGKTVLHLAVENNNVDIIMALLERGADPRAQTHDGRTALWFANGLSGRWIFWNLLNYGADINVRNTEGMTLLHSSARSGLEDVCKLLLSYGALVEIRDHRQETPLHTACRFGHVNVVKVLVGKGGADFNVQNQLNQTPLYLAILGGHDEVVRMLLSQGAKAVLRPKDGWTLSNLAKSQGHEILAQMLKEWEDINAKDRGSESETEDGRMMQEREKRNSNRWSRIFRRG